jgi:hypothetical protein
MKKSNNYGNKIWQATLNRRQAVAAYNAIYIASMKYALHATFKGIQ